MHFGLRKWEFTSPNCLDIPGAGARIDLSRADQLDTDQGWAIVQQDTPIGSDGVSLGEGLTLRDVLAGQSVRDAWYAAVGTRPEGDTLDQILFDHLESKADPTGTDTARPLELAEGRLEVWLGSRQIHITPFANGTRQQRAAFVRMLQRIRGRLDEARTASLAGQIPETMYRKILSIEAAKIGVSATSLRPKTWRADETPLTPETTVTDSFTSFSAFTRVTGAGTYTCNNGLYAYREPAQALNDTVKCNTAMSGNDNWSDLTIQTTSGQTLGNGAEFGPICRLGANGSLCYMMGSNVGSGSGGTPRIIRFGASSNTMIHLLWLDFYSYATYGRLLLFRSKAVGTTITGQVLGNGNTLTGSATDTANPTGLYGGFGAYDGWNSGYATIRAGELIVVTDGQAAAPTVTLATPAFGSAGTVVTLTGTGFVSGGTCTVDGNAATGVSVTSATVAQITTPAGTVGAKNIVWTNPDTQAGTLTNGYTYVAPSGSIPAIYRTHRRQVSRPGR